MGTTLARALASCGYDVAAVVARRASHAKRAASLTSRHTRPLTAAQLHQLPPVNLIFITTPDDLIGETAARLADALHVAPADDAPAKRASAAPAKRASVSSASASSSAGSSVSSSTASSGRRVALHTSGALSSDVLAPLREAGFAVGSLHPLVSVSDAATGVESLRGAFFCVEGEGAAAAAARRVVRRLGGRSFSVRTEDKALYHAAAVMTSGHTVALFQTATELLARCGLDAETARRVLLPLLRSTLENLSKQKPSRALTGTFARADVATVGKHLSALAATGDEEALAVYRVLGRRSLHLAEAGGADAEALREIRRALASHEDES